MSSANKPSNFCFDIYAEKSVFLHDHMIIFIWKWQWSFFDCCITLPCDNTSHWPSSQLKTNRYCCGRYLIKRHQKFLKQRCTFGVNLETRSQENQDHLYFHVFPQESSQLFPYNKIVLLGDKIQKIMTIKMSLTKNKDNLVKYPNFPNIILSEVCACYIWGIRV